MSSSTAVTNAPARRDNKGVFGDNAPSMNVGLPKGMCITAVEFLVYLTNGIRNYEPLLRFVQAGMDQASLTRIVNFHRRWEKHPALG